MDLLKQPMQELEDYVAICDALKKKKTPVQVTGCVECQIAQLAGTLSDNYNNTVIIVSDEIKARELYEDYKLYNRNVYIYPAKDFIFYSADVHSNAIISEIIAVLKRIIEGKKSIIITTLAAGMDHVLPLSYIEEKVIEISVGKELDVTAFNKNMVSLGYQRRAQVETKGEYAIRGGIIDIFPLTEETPYRIELWDDEIDTIRSFDIDSQRSVENVDSIMIYPAMEIILEKDVLDNGLLKIKKEKEEYVGKLRAERKNEEAHRIDTIINEFIENVGEFGSEISIESYVKFFYKDTVSFFDYFNNDSTLFIINEIARIEESSNAIEYEFSEGMAGRLEKGYILPTQAEAVYRYKDVMHKCVKNNTIFTSLLDYKINYVAPKTKIDLTVKGVSPYNNNFELLVKDLKTWKDMNYRVVLVTSSVSRAKRLVEDFTEEGLNAYYKEDRDCTVNEREIVIITGNLRKGFIYPFIKFAIVSDVDIFGATKKKRKKKAYSGTKIQNFTDINVGDYVVHENHGVGVYRGLEKIEVEGVIKDYIKIEYANNGNLYVLATGLDVIQKYAGADAKKPKINKLGSVEWKKTKSRVREAVLDIAKELVELYAIRQSKKGFEFSKDNVWQQEFEEMFPYEETHDQLEAINDTKKDMESARIMDRLICGDVGYGKTEIAIRAAFKAVLDGKQVAFLVPTTILAQQHYNTFSQRMRNFPVTVDMLSRFRTPKQQKEAIERLKNGNLDIIIGTHRLLSKDIQFKNLGLLIIDEEQRFGVTHKEKIKQIKNDVDVLTLSATPIPRTLHMSLVGIRDMSVLEEPPVDRLPIQTYVLEYNEEMIREAINRELARQGQVYYVYNRVNNIVEVANTIKRLVPDAEVAFAHGQMSERELENVMYSFINGEIDVLVSTTIVETGLDISNVNTMIIEDADKFGLSQLYQLRGRVGRSNRTSYAFLMYKRNKILREEAQKRLSAIKEFTELGAGFKIAMKDLEIRGAGNLLGAKQHGHMEAVGYDMYCKMLNEAVMELKGEVLEKDKYETAIELDIDAYIPPTYIRNENQKLDMYKRIAQISNEDEQLDILDEMIDRFGDIPASVKNLLNVAAIRMKAHALFITSIVYKNDKITFTLYEKADIKANNITPFVKSFGVKMKFMPDKKPAFVYTLKRNGTLPIKADVVFEEINKVLNKLEELVIIV